MIASEAAGVAAVGMSTSRTRLDAGAHVNIEDMAVSSYCNTSVHSTASTELLGAAAKTSPQSRNVFLLSPAVSEFRFPV